jgi:hypothetical protein
VEPEVVFPDTPGANALQEMYQDEPAEPAQRAQGRRAVFLTSDAGATKERRRREEGRQRL